MTYSPFPCRGLIGTLFNQSESSKLKKMILVRIWKVTQKKMSKRFVNLP